MAKVRWIEREFKNRNVEDESTRETVPIMYPLKEGLWCCHFPPDGDVTSAIDFDKEGAFRKWEALTNYYEGEAE